MACSPPKAKCFRRATSVRSAILAKALHPRDRGTDADFELFSRFTEGTYGFNKADHPDHQLNIARCITQARMRRPRAISLAR
jgi:hypothetical protein